MACVKSKLDLDVEEDCVVEESPNNRYIRYDEVLGFGNSRAVYKGFDKDDGTEVCWNKFCLSDDVLNSGFCREKLASIRLLKHGNVARYLGSWVDVENKTVNMITESCSSGSLRKFRMKHKGVDMKAIKKWARQILEGLCYLHSRSPPVIHGDLNCDELFINGNGGEVKIGGLGFAMISQQAVGGFVPEFVAPEVFEGAGDQLVDIYAFGMCMLELFTCEYPYSECTNAGQRYKKIASGVKPAALEKVKNQQAKDFIEKCLAPASQRLSATELLKHPFLSYDDSKEPSKCPKFIDANLLQPKSKAPSQISSGCGNVSWESTWSTNAKGDRVLVTEFYISKGNKEWRLRGEKADDNSISFVLLVKDARLHKRLKFEYTFFPKIDNAESVAEELVSCNEELSMEDIPPTRELMDTLLFQLVRGWKSSNRGVNRSSEENAPAENDQHFLQSCRDLLRKSEEAHENDKKSWLSGRMPVPSKSVLSR
ncbi:probable serine/threonine-protein kinase WNK4 [Daucus carota subsp. sativus]|uniref:non-specific serine/threonine protein kinase n=1 Tax=Daucus carota subsp. sativus TaxID=79200 RepID=A0A162A3Y6_DAUCS|nr:PREDICTED: probable serine/threonine-protein kinase WNK4 [Daucus carota subsp. sativus]